MQKVIISIIVPAYNIAAYIGRGLDSILAQTFKEIELIVVDDGSTDQTPLILDDYEKKDSRIRVIHKPNGGVTKARLDGVAIASGAWIGFMDGDDFIEPEFFQTLFENAQNHHADISHCGYKMIFPNGRCDQYYGTGRVVQQDHLTGLKDLLGGIFVEPGLWNKLYRKLLFDPLLTGNLVDSSIKSNEDLLMNYFLFEQAESSIYQDVCLYHYMIRKGSATSGTQAIHKLLDAIAVCRILLDQTQGSSGLCEMAEQRLVRQLVALATIRLKENRKQFQTVRKSVRCELRTKLKKILFGSSFGNKDKITVLWVCLFPASYRFVHDVYAKITGIDEKYDVE